jgi:hypothetical protein
MSHPRVIHIVEQVGAHVRDGHDVTILFTPGSATPRVLLEELVTAIEALRQSLGAGGTTTIEEK